MAWPNLFKKGEPMPTPPNPEVKPAENPPKNEKSVAEMIAESLKPALDALAQQRQDIEEIKQRTAPKPKEPPKPTEIPSVLDDENAAFSVRMAPVMQRQLELEARQARNDVKLEYMELGVGDLWKEYEKEIDAQLLSSSLVRQRIEDGQLVPQRGDPQFIRNTVDMIFGRAAREKGIRFNGEKKTFFLEGASGGMEGAPPSEAAIEGLTPKQVAFAKKIGLSPDQMKKSVSRLEFVS